MSGPTLQIDRAEIEASLLSVLIEAETTREGAAALLKSLVPALEVIAGTPDADSVALAVRDVDGVSLHVLAEFGAPRAWPTSLEPRFSVGALGGVDATTGAVVVPLRASGRVVGALLVIDAIFASAVQRDPTIGQLLQTAADVLDALVARTDAAVGRRAATLRSVESVIEGIAHQIANPLTGASAIAQLLAEEIEDDGQRAAVKQINVELARAAAVLRDLLDFQRQTGAHSGVLDLNGIVEGITQFRGYAIREQGIALDVQTMPRTAQVRVDGRSVEHALLQVLRFAENQSRGSVNRSISVRVGERDGSEFCVEITDSGPGDLPELTSAYFDLRFRDDHGNNEATEKPDLGLADSILRRAGGKLEARASKAEGTTLALVLPRAVTGNYSAQVNLT
jgi:signal transduction histidine kinase